MNIFDVGMILFLATDPSDLPRLRIDQEIRDVENRLKLSKHGKNFPIKHHLSVRIKELNFIIRDAKPYIIHFSGHGYSTGELCLEDDDGKSCPLKTQLLTKIFKAASKNVRCVILNACYSESQAMAISEHVDYVIGMNQAIGDKAAIAFSVGFYGALGAGDSIEEAYESGCIDIESSGIKEYLTPVLYRKEQLLTDNNNKEVEQVNNGKMVVVCSGEFQEIDLPQIEAFLSHLQTFSKQELKITLKKIEPGSIKLYFDGTPEDIKRIRQLIQSGKVENISGLPIEQLLLLRDLEKNDLVLTTSRRHQVPMMFRAQIEGRCQLQRIIRNQKSDSELWAYEWIDKTFPTPPHFGEEVQTRTFQFTWRFITNSGQDDGVIRPAIGAKGWPFYPGSSMKGLFRQAAERMEDLGELKPGTCDRYCGNASNQDPGILRFHGGYPTDTRWTENLVDIVHPQQQWQVKSNDKEGGAFMQISLYKPELKFGISSTVTDVRWEEIWTIWEEALSMGIGSRVSAGYGQPETHVGDILYRTQLKGQGQAAKLVSGTGEFRPNIFRAAIRGHALRIFGGLTDAETAENLIKDLFGGVHNGTTVGLLSMAFRTTELDLDEFGQGSYAQPTYEVEGELLWMLTKSLPDPEKQALTKLIEALTRFAMVFGGFGKSWRRVDHRLVYPDYYDKGYKPLIGCHWEWVGKRSQVRDVRVYKLEHVSRFINEVHQAAQDWMHLRNITPNPRAYANWREAWHPSNVQVWGRPADSIEDCEAVRWLHGPYQEAIPSAGIPEGSIYSSSLTGKMGQIGRLWHRMYPQIRLVKDPENPKRPKPKTTSQYFELLTIFPDQSIESDQFLDFLNSQQKFFQQLWPPSV